MRETTPEVKTTVSGALSSRELRWLLCSAFRRVTSAYLHRIYWNQIVGWNIQTQKNTTRRLAAQRSLTLLQKIAKILVKNSRFSKT